LFLFPLLNCFEQIQPKERCFHNLLQTSEHHPLQHCQHSAGCSVGRLIWDISHSANGRFEGWRVHVRGHRNVDLYVVCNAAPQSEVNTFRHDISSHLIQWDPDDLNWDFALIMYLRNRKRQSRDSQKCWTQHLRTKWLNPRPRVTWIHHGLTPAKQTWRDEKSEEKKEKEKKGLLSQTFSYSCTQMHSARSKGDAKLCCLYPYQRFDMRVQPVAHELKLTIWPEKLSETVSNCLVSGFQIGAGFRRRHEICRWFKTSLPIQEKLVPFVSSLLKHTWLTLSSGRNERYSPIILKACKLHTLVELNVLARLASCRHCRHCRHWYFR